MSDYESNLKAKMEATFQREFERQYKLANDTKAKEELLKEADKPKRGRKRIFSDEERRTRHSLASRRYQVKHKEEIKEYQRSYQKDRVLTKRQRELDK